MSVLISKLAKEVNSLNVPTEEVKGTALCINYGDQQINFVRSLRKSNANRVLIKVHPDCRVAVQAPSSASDNDIVVAVKKRARWILTQLKYFKEQMAHMTPRQYVSGEGHYYLGKQYQLKVLVETAGKQQVKLFRGVIVVTTRSKSSEKVRELLLSWYKDRAKETFQKRLSEMLPKTIWVSDIPPIRIKTMQTQWGSCSPSGRLTLNPHLVKASRDCIDYVLLHELCHIAEHNHSDRFYRLMKQVMPEWEKVKERLDGSAAAILNGV